MLFLLFYLFFFLHKNYFDIDLRLHIFPKSLVNIPGKIHDYFMSQSSIPQILS